MSTWQVSDKRIMVTGATSGIGRETVRGLARRGAEIIAVGRDEKKCRNTVQEIHEITGNDTAEYFVADLSVQQEIRDLADAFLSKYHTLDVLLNNAGAVFASRQESEDGLEMTLALNHLNYFLLTNLLLNALRQSTPARIINVSSDAHRGQQVNFEDLHRTRKYSPMPVYGESKLMNILFTYELDRRLDDDKISVNALHPGFVASGFGKNNGVFMSLLMSVLHLFARSEQKGAETSIYLASDPDLQGVSGKYFFDKAPKDSSPESYDVDTAVRLWDISKELTGLDATV